MKNSQIPTFLSAILSMGLLVSFSPINSSETRDVLLEAGKLNMEISHHQSKQQNTNSAYLKTGVFDLALMQSLNTQQTQIPIFPGQLVTFNLTIFNQGDLPATGIRLVDYIPYGLTLEDSNWTQTGNLATLNSSFVIGSGLISFMTITFRVDAGMVGELTNTIEISSANDEFGNPATDVDSTPDAINNDLVMDNEINHPNDEDDHDIESIMVEGDEDDDDDLPTIMLETIAVKTQANDPNNNGDDEVNHQAEFRDPEIPTPTNDAIQTVMNQTVYCYPMDNDEMNGEMLDFGIETPANYGEVGLFGQRFVYVPATDVCGETDQFAYFVTNATGTSTATVEVQILCDDLVAYSGFSPNGDNINDKFIIEGIEKYPANKVLIFNRWGNEVYRKGGYDNNDPWDGSANGELVTGGTYFYVIDDGEGRKYSGYVEVAR